LSHYVANAVLHQDNLEFLEDMIPKTVPLKKIRATAAATQARLRGEIAIDDRPPTSNGTAAATLVNGSVPASSSSAAMLGALRPGDDRGSDDPNDQLELEMRQAAGQGHGDGDVHMTG
jgi:DNA polymerase epsilon subunit 4